MATLIFIIRFIDSLLRPPAFWAFNFCAITISLPYDVSMDSDCIHQIMFISYDSEFYNLLNCQLGLNCDVDHNCATPYTLLRHYWHTLKWLIVTVILFKHSLLYQRGKSQSSAAWLEKYLNFVPPNFEFWFKCKFTLSMLQ